MKEKEEINIGADELILWLRKNGKATNIPNDEIHGLGIKICHTIEDLGGHIVTKDQDCYWANENGNKNIGQFNLPKTAAQYALSIDKLPDLFDELKHW